MPDSWHYSEAVTQTLPSDDSWWTSFDDPILDSLIAMSESCNFDLAAAQARMQAAAQQINSARAAFFPTIGINAGYTRARSEGINSNIWTLQGSVSWEIDVFGKVAAQVRQKKAAYRATRAEWVATMVSMAGQTASTYMQLRVWQAELAVALAHVSSQDSITRIVQARFDCGLAAKAQLAQAEASLHSIEASVPALKYSIHSAISSLALLCGVYPEDLRPMLEPFGRLPEYQRLIAAGVPAELLRRRPDIVEAEYQLAAAAAAVGVAKKDFLPTLSLQGSVGVSAPHIGDMFTSRGFAYSIAPTLSWTVFDGLARRAAVAEARAAMEAQIDSYNQSVLNAYNEVDNAICAYTEYVAQSKKYELARDNAAEFLKLSLDLYTQGLSPYSDVATAQQNLLDYSNSLITAQGNALTALVKLYEALGGGFDQNL